MFWITSRFIIYPTTIIKFNSIFLAVLFCLFFLFFDLLNLGTKIGGLLSFFIYFFISIFIFRFFCKVYHSFRRLNEHFADEYASSFIKPESGIQTAFDVVTQQKRNSKLHPTCKERMIFIKNKATDTIYLLFSINILPAVFIFYVLLVLNLNLFFDPMPRKPLIVLFCIFNLPFIYLHIGYKLLLTKKAIICLIVWFVFATCMLLFPYFFFFYLSYFTDIADIVNVGLLESFINLTIGYYHNHLFGIIIILFCIVALKNRQKTLRESA